MGGGGQHEGGRAGKDRVGGGQHERGGTGALCTGSEHNGYTLVCFEIFNIFESNIINVFKNAMELGYRAWPWSIVRKKLCLKQFFIL